MRQILLQGPREFATQETPDPFCDPGFALVRIHQVGVCGSDMHLYRDARIGEIALTEPMVIGHECMGSVVAIGSESDRWLVGKRVAVEPAIPCRNCHWCQRGLHNICPEVKFLGLPPTQGAMQELLVHPTHLLFPLPDSISDAAAVVLEPMAIALHAIHLSKVFPGESVVILGVGVLGTCVLELLRMIGGLEIIAVDLLPDRLQRAKDMGAKHTLLTREGEREEISREIRRLTGGLGAARVFECSGAGEAIWNTAEVAGPGGHVIMIGTHADDLMQCRFGSVRRKGLTYRFVRRSLNTLDTCLEYAQKKLIDPERLVTHILPASQVKDAFEMVDHYSDGVLKVLVDMRAWT